MTVRTLQVDVTDLAETMDYSVTDGIVSALDLRTGEIVHPTEEPDDNLLTIPPFGSQYRYGRMVRFAAKIEGDTASVLTLALNGRGATARFKNLIHQRGIADAWYAFQLGIDREEAMAWLASNDITAIDVSKHVPVAPAAPEVDTIGLADLLMLGAPDDKPEVGAATVHRMVAARSTQHSRDLFVRLAREVCGMTGVGSPDPSGESDIVNAGRYRLQRHHDRVELAVDVSQATWERFAPAVLTADSTTTS